MTISLQNKNNRFEMEAISIAGRLLSMPINSLTRIGGGLNGRVYRLGGKDACKYVLKFYYKNHADKRDRCAVEFSSLTFLWNNGVSYIPQPITMDEDAGCAVYEFIEGSKMPPGEITGGDIMHAVNFLAELNNIRNKIANSSLASEACFSVGAVIENIQTRLDRLRVIKETAEEYETLHKYLEYDFIPFWKILKHWVQNKCGESDICFDGNIKEDEKILSPSDFGFHNALRNKGGRIIFLDFEYFGWDDPAKTISDFLLHPAMELGQDCKQRFVTGVLDLFNGDTRLKERVKIYYPLFSLKWCLIFLNEFFPGDFGRRDFARMETRDKQSILKEQLLKTQRMLNEVKQTFKEFPLRT